MLELFALIFIGVYAFYGWVSLVRDVILYLEKLRGKVLSLREITNVPINEECEICHDIVNNAITCPKCGTVLCTTCWVGHKCD